MVKTFKKQGKLDSKIIIIVAIIIRLLSFIIIYPRYPREDEDYLALLQTKSFMKYPGNTILIPDPKGYDNYSVRDPFVFKKDGKYFMFYHRYKGRPAVIGVAISKDGFDFV